MSGNGQKVFTKFKNGEICAVKTLRVTSCTGNGRIWPNLPKSHLQKELLCGQPCLQTDVIPKENVPSRVCVLCHIPPAQTWFLSSCVHSARRCNAYDAVLQIYVWGSVFLSCTGNSSETLICIWRGFPFPCSWKFPQVLTYLLFALPPSPIAL